MKLIHLILVLLYYNLHTLGPSYPMNPLPFPKFHNHSLEMAFSLSTETGKKIPQSTEGNLRVEEKWKSRRVKYVMKKPKHLLPWLINCHLGNWIEGNCLHYFSRYEPNLNKSHLINFESPVKEAKKIYVKYFPRKRH